MLDPRNGLDVAFNRLLSGHAPAPIPSIKLLPVPAAKKRWPLAAGIAFSCLLVVAVYREFDLLWSGIAEVLNCHALCFLKTVLK